MRKSIILIILMILFFSSITVMAQEYQFEGCGYLTRGVEAGCILFDTDDYGDYLVFDIPDDYDINDYVWVSGMVDPDCESYCMQGEGCLHIDSIAFCKPSGGTIPLSDCGVLVAGVELDCVLFNSFHFGNYIVIGLPAEYSIGDTVEISGMVDPDCLSYCMQGDGCLFVKSIDYCLPTDVENYDKNLLPDITLLDNYPNPFNQETVIEFSLSRRARAVMTVYNITGVEVIQLLDEELPAGNHEIQWDGCDRSGNPMATGIYFYSLKTDDFIEYRKMLLLK